MSYSNISLFTSIFSFINKSGKDKIILYLKIFNIQPNYTLSEAWSGVKWTDSMAAQGVFRTDFYDRSILRLLKHRAYYRSGRHVVKIGPKGALGSHEIRPIHSAPSLGQSIVKGVLSVACDNFSMVTRFEPTGLLDQAPFLLNLFLRPNFVVLFLNKSRDILPLFELVHC